MKKNKNIICGKWIIEKNSLDWLDDNLYSLFIKCSECGYRHFLGTTDSPNKYDEENFKRMGVFSNHPYCPHCKRKMRNK